MMVFKMIHTTTIRRIIKVLFAIPLVYMTANSTFAKGIASNPSHLTSITLLLDWTPNTNHVGAYVANYQGYFEEENLLVEIPPVAEASVESLVGNGKAEFGFSYQESVTFARASNTPIPIVAIAAIIQHNSSGFAAPKDRNIVSPAHFKDKIYGAFGSPIEEALLNTIMAPYGLDSTDLTMVPAGTLDFFQGTSSKIFDFAWIFEGWTLVEAELNNQDLYYLSLRELDIIFDYYTPVIISSKEYLDNNPDTARAFMRALKKGYRWAIENPRAAADMLLFYVPELNPTLVRNSMNYLAPRFTDDAPYWGYMQDEVWNRYTSWLKSNGFIDANFSDKEIYTNRFIEE